MLLPRKTHSRQVFTSSKSALVKAIADFEIEISKSATQRWRHVYGFYGKGLRAKHGFAEFCFLCSQWLTKEDDWTDHCQSHLDQPAMLPTQCSPFSYGGCLAAPGICPWCLGDDTTRPTSRVRRFLDRAEWQGHIKKHIEELDGCKVPVCPHPRPQCEEAFDSVQKLIFHLQDVHCWVPRKGCKRRRSEDEAELMPHKAKRQSKAKSHEDACGKQEYQFVDEGPKIWALDLQD